MKEMKSYGEIIKNRRQELGISIRQLAGMMGVNPSTILRWESGRISGLRKQNMDGLSRCLHLPMEAFDGASETTPEEDLEAMTLRTTIEYQLKGIKDVKSLRLISNIVKEIKKEEGR